ncbi:MAG: FadR family transcriptional regulator [Rhodobacteraceae bacterium]|nr:FadR family transcriptional regulator [Paracoccaceae bacterium]
MTKRSRPVQVAEEIKNWVVEQGLKPGDRLPAEPELIERFGMSKGTIREATRLLEAQGLLKTRTGPGGGAFIHAVSRERATALLGNYFYFKDLNIGDLYQMRVLLEPEMAAGLAGNISKGQIEELRTIVESYNTPPEDLDAERAHHVQSLKFHGKLAEYAKNELLGFVISFVSRALSDVTLVRGLYEPRNFELWKFGRDSHLVLIEALAKGDGTTARQVMLRHMEFAYQQMQNQELQVNKKFIPETY